MLEQFYWVAGIVVAIAAVVGLLLHRRSRANSGSNQNVEIKGDGNAVNQSSNFQADKKSDN